MPTKTRLSDLNDHLFAQLERLADESLTSEQIADEVKRSEAIVSLADQVAGNARLGLAAAKLFVEAGSQVLPYLPQIGKAKDGA